LSKLPKVACKWLAVRFEFRTRDLLIYAANLWRCFSIRNVATVYQLETGRQQCISLQLSYFLSRNHIMTYTFNPYLGKGEGDETTPSAAFVENRIVSNGMRHLFL